MKRLASLSSCLLGALAPSHSPAVLAQTKPIRLIAPCAAGGLTARVCHDAVVRARGAKGV